MIVVALVIWGGRSVTVALSSTEHSRSNHQPTFAIIKIRIYLRSAAECIWQRQTLLGSSTTPRLIGIATFHRSKRDEIGFAGTPDVFLRLTSGSSAEQGSWQWGIPPSFSEPKTRSFSARCFSMSSLSTRGSLLLLLVTLCPSSTMECPPLGTNLWSHQECRIPCVRLENPPKNNWMNWSIFGDAPHIVFGPRELKNHYYLLIASLPELALLWLVLSPQSDRHSNWSLRDEADCYDAIPLTAWLSWIEQVSLISFLNQQPWWMFSPIDAFCLGGFL